MNRRHTLMLTVAGAALAALLAAVLLGVKVAAAGWLIAFFYVGAISLGSLALLLIHRLTGGHWGDALRPLLEPAAACIPLLAVLFVPVLIATPLLYPWFEGAGDVKPDVAALYLNMPLFVVRAVISFVGWSVLALALSRIGGRAGTLLAAVGLIFYAVTISLVSVDWVLSGEPVFISTSFGASVAIMQLLAALAFAAMV
ncbi:MAG TPA: hypothetical protein VG986_08170, partial [Pseudolabrys sp.]|nr:hypothetical protein [Pseudolabrys sp.]